ncbi:Ribonuclease BN [Acidisarcina polymorpha]|uniref:Ribonuclease BN n=1 Tax=Acidisarcina polymorpha TaxID=2211140 RepID=A0A2Z5G0V7_9BACT|nr:YihY/virulence factor BrkB family protein [Acidisarcina polymorpha]AXC12768.1 Ribonuclease BN [Acidisarcina polymorpha]
MVVHRAEEASLGKIAMEKARSRWAQSSWNLQRLGIKLIAQRTWESMTKDDLTGRSAQLAYYFFFSLFPGLVAASAVLGMVATSGRAFSDRLIDYLATVIPPAAFDIVLSTFNQTTHASSGGKVVVGLLVALWSASAGTSAIQDALNSVHKVKERRPFWKARLEAVLLTIFMAILFTMALTVLLGGDIVAGYLSHIVNLPLFFRVLTRMLTWPIAFAISAVAFALVYYVAPDVEHAEWRWITPGATIGIVLWLLVSTGLRIYLHFFNSYSVTYGSLGAVIVLLTWFYLSGLAVLMGAEINMVIEDLAARQGERGAKKEGEKVPQSENA